jgi:hypothetical protein
MTSLPTSSGKGQIYWHHASGCRPEPVSSSVYHSRPAAVSNIK